MFYKRNCVKILLSLRSFASFTYSFRIKGQTKFNYFLTTVRIPDERTRLACFFIVDEFTMLIGEESNSVLKITYVSVYKQILLKSSPWLIQIPDLNRHTLSDYFGNK